MALDMGKWKDIFEWSMKYQDGTRPTDYASAEMSEEKREWLEKAMGELMKDLGDRMREIKAALDAPHAPGGQGAPHQPADGPPRQGGAGRDQAAAPAAAAAPPAATLAEREALLDELMEIVESVDHARDLHAVGGLGTLLALMACPYPSLRWRAAEVAATCMANNPPVQRWFLEGGAMPALMALLADPDAACRTKALLALSALVRHYDPGLEAFRLAGGLEKLLELIGADIGGGSGGGGAAQQQGQQQAAGAAAAGEAAAEAAAAQRRLRRKALALLQYVISKHPADAGAAARMGACGALQQILEDPEASSDLRAAGLAVLVEIASQPDGWAAARERAPGLAELIAKLAAAHTALPADDREADAEEGEELARASALLGAAAPPEAKAAARDHVEVDPWQDGQRASKTLSVNTPGGQQQPQQQQQQQKPQPVLALGPPQ